MEFDDHDTLQPLNKELRSIKTEDIEISEEYRYFFETIIGDFEETLNESYEWVRSIKPAN